MPYQCIQWMFSKLQISVLEDSLSQCTHIYLSKQAQCYEKLCSYSKKLCTEVLPIVHPGGAATALLALILCAYLISSSDDIFPVFALLADFSFCFAWKTAVAYNKDLTPVNKSFPLWYYTSYGFSFFCIRNSHTVAIACTNLLLGMKEY